MGYFVPKARMDVVFCAEGAHRLGVLAEGAHGWWYFAPKVSMDWVFRAEGAHRLVSLRMDGGISHRMRTQIGGSRQRRAWLRVFCAKGADG